MEYEIPCSAPECDFIGRARNLSNARRATRVHALKEHRQEFVREDLPLLDLTDAELQARLNTYSRAQWNSAQRREHLRSQALDVDAAPGPSSAGGSAPGSTLGPRTKCARVGDRPPGRSPGADLSAGQDPADLGPEPFGEILIPDFIPPLGKTPDEIADLYMVNIGRRPSSIAGMLCAPGERPDDALLFWTETLAALQKRMGQDLANRVQDAMTADPSGAAAFDEGVAMLSRLARRPLND